MKAKAWAQKTPQKPQLSTPVGEVGLRLRLLDRAHRRRASAPTKDNLHDRRHGRDRVPSAAVATGP
jgi:hypothetical protein